MKIIVTGSNGLIGKGLVDYLLKNGHKVKGFDISNGDDLQNNELNAKLFQENKEYNRLINLFAINDHVNNKVNNDKSILEYDINNLRKYCDINIIALFDTCRNFIKYSDSPKSIINLSSLYGISSPKHNIYDKPKDISYTITKHAVIGLSKHLATFFAEEDIRINCIAPGGILHEQPESFIKKYSSNTPMKRMMNKHEIYPLIEFLSSDNKAS